jgi:hypothetical protein
VTKDEFLKKYRHYRTPHKEAAEKQAELVNSFADGYLVNVSRVNYPPGFYCLLLESVREEVEGGEV